MVFMVPQLLRLILLGITPLAALVSFSPPTRSPAANVSAAKTFLLATPLLPDDEATTRGRDACACQEDDDSDGSSSDSRRANGPGGKVTDAWTRPVLPAARRHPANGPSGLEANSLIYQLRKLLI
jgi:hypothetical protein